MAPLQQPAVHENDWSASCASQELEKVPIAVCCQQAGGCSDGVGMQDSPTPLVLAHPEMALVTVTVLVLEEPVLDPALSGSS